MTKTFFCKLLNNPFSDPVMILEFTRSQRFFLFDIGDLSSLPVRHLQKISHVFVSHMHIDHFIGFDTLLRSLLGRDTPLYVYGPAGIINAVSGKLAGFTWNLIKEYPLKIEVLEITETGGEWAGFYAQDGFSKNNKGVLKLEHAPIDKAAEVCPNIIYKEPAFSIHTAIFDHQIPVLGYTIIEDTAININKAALLEHGLKPGPWLTELKDKIRINDYHHKLDVYGTQLSVSDLSDIIIVTKGQKIAYITDISNTKENIEKAVSLAKNADILFIEAYFLDRDYNNAKKIGHLTAKTTGYIANMANVKKIELIHISKKYLTMKDIIKDEVYKEFCKKIDI